MAITREWVDAWGSMYPLQYDAQIEKLANKARPAFAEVEAAVRWKSTRNLGRFRTNTRDEVERAVRAALTADDPQVALDHLIVLRGVQVRVASAILAIFRPRDYTVIDERAWRSLAAHGHLEGLERVGWARRWVPYLMECRTLRTILKLPDLRGLDRALYMANGSIELPLPGASGVEDGLAEGPSARGESVDRTSSGPRRLGRPSLTVAAMRHHWWD